MKNNEKQTKLSKSNFVGFYGCENMTNCIFTSTYDANAIGYLDCKDVKGCTSNITKEHSTNIKIGNKNINITVGDKNIVDSNKNENKDGFLQKIFKVIIDFFRKSI